MKRILIAEDKELNQRLYQSLYSPLAEVEIVSSGQEALERIERGVDKLDLIVLDGSMPPGPTGDVIARRCKELYPTLRVVLNTSNPNDYKHLGESGIPVFDKTPYTLLLEYVRRILEE
ncbi:response regulator [Candidatus Woesearchaeota archaeon]|nr:response regulator [Candidatus Woesearchaeota archaeon]